MAEVDFLLMTHNETNTRFYGYNSLQKHVIDVRYITMLGVGRLAHNTTNTHFFVCQVLNVQ